MLLVATERITIGSAVDVPAPGAAVAQLSHAFGAARRRDLGYAAAKRLLDIVAAAALLLVLLPVFVVVAIAIRLDTPRPGFYRAERIGRLGKPVRVVKFRPMQGGCPANPH